MIKNKTLNLIRNLLFHKKIQTILKQISFRQKQVNIENKSNPYIKILNKKNIYEPIFISGRFRSGSTLLWNIFRNLDGYTSYYEPFNERRWFNVEDRGSKVDETHVGVTNYWKEYEGLEHLDALYDEGWTTENLLMDESSFYPNMEKYIEELIVNAKGKAVLQFNRVDFRLQWLRHYFPKAKIVHIYRHPREQWLSFLADKELMNKDDVEFTYQDGFYLNTWCQNLQHQFPFLSEELTPHPYQRFYYLWKLSYLYGKKYSDISFSFESLVEDPHGLLKMLFDKLKIINPNIEKCSQLINKPRLDKWKTYADESWFYKFEEECEQTLSLYLKKN